MSLRDLGVFDPLREDHPLVGDSCWKCGVALSAGSRVALNPVQTPEETGTPNVVAKAICATCHMKGKAVKTPVGSRIVEGVKDGDGSPFPVMTTDGRQWRDEEVS